MPKIKKKKKKKPVVPTIPITPITPTDIQLPTQPPVQQPQATITQPPVVPEVTRQQRLEMEQQEIVARSKERRAALKEPKERVFGKAPDVKVTTDPATNKNTYAITFTLGAIGTEERTETLTLSQEEYDVYLGGKGTVTPNVQRALDSKREQGQTAKTTLESARTEEQLRAQQRITPEQELVMPKIAVIEERILAGDTLVEALAAAGPDVGMTVGGFALAGGAVGGPLGAAVGVVAGAATTFVKAYLRTEKANHQEDVRNAKGRFRQSYSGLSPIITNLRRGDFSQAQAEIFLAHLKAELDTAESLLVEKEALGQYGGAISDYDRDLIKLRVVKANYLQQVELGIQAAAGQPADPNAPEFILPDFNDIPTGV